MTTQELTALLSHARACKLSAGSLQTLAHLHEHKSATQTELAFNLNVATASMTGIADKLEKLELARRQYGTSDRRTIHIHITPAGIAIMDTLLAGPVHA